LTDHLSTGLHKDRFTIIPDIILAADGVKTDHALVVDGSSIEAVCPVAALSERDKKEAIPLLGKAIIPGFIDAHTHLGQTFGKALIGGEPAQIWRRIWAPMEHALDLQGCYVSAKWQFLELFRGGYTGVINYSLNDAERNAAVHRAAEETGIRLISATGLDEITEDGTHLPRSAIFERAEELIEQCAGTGDMIQPSICCGSFYGITLETLAALKAFCDGRGIILQIHANEHFPEVHECILRYGKRPIELLASAGVLGENTLLHHTTLANDHEIELLRESRTGVSYNPVASQWKGNAVAPALAYAERGVRMGIGTDNTRADAFRMLDAAESCQRLTFGMRVADFSCGAAWLWVDALSRGSADVAGWKARAGVLAAGKAADFLILNMAIPEAIPSWDFEWELVRYYGRDQVDAVVVNGKPVMIDRTPVGWDDQEFMAEYRDLAYRVGSAPDIKRVHGPSGPYRAAKFGRVQS
jgi:5-methylthioadenosine/S-adenosylhomocysteine deaminase